MNPVRLLRTIRFVFFILSAMTVAIVTFAFINQQRSIQILKAIEQQAIPLLSFRNELVHMQWWLSMSAVSTEPAYVSMCLERAAAHEKQGRELFQSQIVSMELPVDLHNQRGRLKRQMMSCYVEGRQMAEAYFNGDYKRAQKEAIEFACMSEDIGNEVDSLVARQTQEIRKSLQEVNHRTNQIMVISSAALLSFVLLGFLNVLVHRRYQHYIHQEAHERRVLEDQIRQSHKMDAIGQLAGGVAHDFNNILSSMMLNLELIGVDQDEGNTVKALNIQHALIQRAAGLTKQLLLFSRKEEFNLQTLDLHTSVRQTLRILSRLIGENITIIDKMRENPLWIQADIGMLDQVIMNIAINARDAMPQGGVLTFVSEIIFVTRSQNHGFIRVEPGRYVCLQISDTGCGMSAEVVQRIFEPFFTTKEIGKGTGLGLATVYGIVQRLHGEISVESIVGKGTTFKILFPLSNQVGFNVADKSVSIMRGEGELVLLVEDDDFLRQIQTHSLESAGYRVISAANGDEAIDLWKKHSKEVRLLLTDMRMPGVLTGRDLAKRFAHQRPDLKCIIISGYFEKTEDNEQFTDGSVIYLAKPVEAARLLESIHYLLHDQVAHQSTGAKGTQKERVLILDDDTTLLEAYTRILHKLGYEVIPVNSGKEAVLIYESFFRQHLPFKGIILDIRMDDGDDGNMVLARIKAIDPSVKAICASGDPNDPVMREPFEYGFVAALDKPFSKEQLTAVMTSIG